jgi:pimeloyl-ACP methyl ester carboxylesterase
MAHFRERRVEVGEVTLNVVMLGEGEPVLMLHGFPSFSACWRKQMQALAGAGFCAIAPDLRGYNLSSKPKSVAAYKLSTLVDDVVGLARALGHEAFHLVAHDWGGVIAFAVASSHPELIRKLVILNAPHPEKFRSALQHTEQVMKSWYTLMFQLPILPEWFVQRRSAMHLALRGVDGSEGGFDDAEFEAYLGAMRRPGAAHGALNYYRAAFRWPVRAREPISAPTLVLWGENDVALSADLLLEGLDTYVPKLKVVRVPGAGHWLHHERPELVNSEILAFLS